MLIPTIITITAANLLITVLVILDRRSRRVAAAEYRRASRAYRDLVDHRLANPLTVIEGAAHTLLDDELLLPATAQRQLLEQIVEQAHRIERISLSARVVLSSEERGLQPLPQPRDVLEVA